MKKLPGLSAALLIAGLCVGANFSAKGALYLTPTGPDGVGIDNAILLPGGANPAPSAIAAALGVSLANLTPVLFKDEEAKYLSGSYDVIYNYNGVSEDTALVYKGDPKEFFGTSKLTWFLAKDGAAGHYLWNLTDIWDGKETLVIRGSELWPGPGELSHFEIGGAAVPEPSTIIAGALLLLPFAASTLRRLRRKHA